MVCGIYMEGDEIGSSYEEEPGRVKAWVCKTCFDAGQAARRKKESGADVSEAKLAVVAVEQLAAARAENQRLREMWKSMYIDTQKSVGGEPDDAEANAVLDAAVKAKCEISK